MLKTLVEKNRSYRRFDESSAVSTDTLQELVDLARITACGANKQALRYWLVSGKDETAKVFPHLGWAGYLKDWDGPPEGERPTAYILLLQKEDYQLGSSLRCRHCRPDHSARRCRKKIWAAAFWPTSTGRRSKKPSPCRKTWISCSFWPSASPKKISSSMKSVQVPT